MASSSRACCLSVTAALVLPSAQPRFRASIRPVPANARQPLSVRAVSRRKGGRASGPLWDMCHSCVTKAQGLRTPGRSAPGFVGCNEGAYVDPPAAGRTHPAALRAVPLIGEQPTAPVPAPQASTAFFPLPLCRPRSGTTSSPKPSGPRPQGGFEPHGASHAWRRKCRSRPQDYPMFVQLLKEFMGHRPGERSDVSECDANALIA
jgi:hypothetical protein